jgi:glucuronosyltransferase
VYWTEYVIRHKGAPHMRSAALDLTWYQYFLLDVFAVLALILGSFFLIAFLLLKALLTRMCGGKCKEVEKTLKKKRN